MVGQKYFEENRSTLQERMFENKGFTFEVFWNIRCPIEIDRKLLAMTSVTWEHGELRGPFSARNSEVSNFTGLQLYRVL